MTVWPSLQDFIPFRLLLAFDCRSHPDCWNLPSTWTWVIASRMRFGCHGCIASVMAPLGCPPDAALGSRSFIPDLNAFSHVPTWRVDPTGLYRLRLRSIVLSVRVPAIQRSSAIPQRTDHMVDRHASYINLLACRCRSNQTV